MGFAVEAAVGYRQARARFADGTKLEMSSGLVEARLGVGADIRLSSELTLSPLVSAGVGSFSRVRWVLPNGTGYEATGAGDTTETHGWLTLAVAGHFDLFGRY
jgi:hypothetical protein